MTLSSLLTLAMQVFLVGSVLGIGAYMVLDERSRLRLARKREGNE